MVQLAGTEAACPRLPPVPARIVIVGRMKGLVDIPDEMKDEFQRDKPLFESIRESPSSATN